MNNKKKLIIQTQIQSDKSKRVGGHKNGPVQQYQQYCNYTQPKKKKKHCMSFIVLIKNLHLHAHAAKHIC